MLLQGSQQHFDSQMWLKHAGDLQPTQGEPDALLVDPETIAGQYLYEPVNGTLPTDPIALSSLYKEFLTVAAGDAVIGSRYDIPGIFEYIMQLSGAKDIGRFRIVVQPDGAISNGTQQGNIVPIGGNQQIDDGGSEQAAIRANSPAQFSGLGPFA
jgi:hypothetical protein